MCAVVGTGDVSCIDKSFNSYYDDEVVRNLSIKHTCLCETTTERRKEKHFDCHCTLCAEQSDEKI